MEDYDLFGMAFQDHYEGHPEPLYLERDDGYADEQRMRTYFADYDDFMDSEKQGLLHVKGKVLDLGVGAGRVALYLQDKGHEVVGVDLSERALDVARRRGVKKLLKMSACDLRFPEASFDSAIACGNNFGICGNMSAVGGMMRALHRILRPGGIFLACSVQPTRTKNPAHTRYQRKNRAKGLPPGQVRLREKYKGMVGPWWSLLLVTPSEMRSLCNATGWKIVKIYRGDSDAYVLSRV